MKTALRALTALLLPLWLAPGGRAQQLPLATRDTPQAQPVSGTQQPLQRSRYHIHEGDQVLVEYTYTPEFNQTVTVQPDGFVTLKVGNDVKAAGRTLDEFQAAIAESVSVRLKDPVITVTLTDFQHPYFVVAGEALAPNKYELRENTTVLKGIMLAGGIRITGKEKQVVLIHALGTSDQTLELLDLKKVHSTEIFEHDREIASGDIIFIPRNKITHAQQITSLLNSPVSYLSTAAYIVR